MPTDESFAERLRHLLTERSLTVPQFHEELHGAVSQRTIFRWLAGRAEPGIRALPLVARALGTTPNDLTGWGNE